MLPAEAWFQLWYNRQANDLNLNPNPDDPDHFYDWRAAFASGATPDESSHWPSAWKREGHPNLYVDGVDTRTGEPTMPMNDPSGFLSQYYGGQYGFPPDPPALPQDISMALGINPATAGMRAAGGALLDAPLGDWGAIARAIGAGLGARNQARDVRSAAQARLGSIEDQYSRELGRHQATAAVEHEGEVNRRQEHLQQMESILMDLSNAGWKPEEIHRYRRNLSFLAGRDAFDDLADELRKNAQGERKAGIEEEEMRERQELAAGRQAESAAARDAATLARQREAQAATMARTRYSQQQQNARTRFSASAADERRAAAGAARGAAAATKSAIQEFEAYVEQLESESVGGGAPLSKAEVVRVTSALAANPQAAQEAVRRIRAALAAENPEPLDKILRKLADRILLSEGI